MLPNSSANYLAGGDDHGGDAELNELERLAGINGDANRTGLELQISDDEVPYDAATYK